MLELVHVIRTTFAVLCFFYKIKTLMDQRYEEERRKSSLHTFYSHYHKLFNRYDIFVNKFTISSMFVLLALKITEQSS